MTDRDMLEEANLTVENSTALRIELEEVKEAYAELMRENVELKASLQEALKEIQFYECEAAGEDC